MDPVTNFSTAKDGTADGNAAEEGFALHPQLAADTAPVLDLPLCRVLLMRNSAFPWLILVPRLADAVELHRLAPHDRTWLMEEVALAGQVLESLEQPDKLNVAALGNQVPQLHVHVIARRRTDAAWPNPVWGTPRVDYGPGEADAYAARLAAAFRGEG